MVNGILICRGGPDLPLAFVGAVEASNANVALHRLFSLTRC
jgi:hypothetical protein